LWRIRDDFGNGVLIRRFAGIRGAKAQASILWADGKRSEVEDVNDLLTAIETAPDWFWMVLVAGLIIAVMVRNQRQAYAYGVWDATHTPDSPAVTTVLNSVERRAWRDGEVAHLFATDVQLASTSRKRHPSL
jgi:hypothetical protein